MTTCFKEAAELGRVVVLTLARHRQGAWVTSLLLALEKRLDKTKVAVELVSLDDVSGDSLLPACGSPRCMLLVNRVSDAAPAALVKKCLALLSICELNSIPVVNGSHSLIIGTSKMLHHQVLSHAGGEVPRSVIVADGENVQDRPKLFCKGAASLLQKGCSWPLIAKPNSGGFGAGIIQFRTMEELADWVQQTNCPISGDGIVVLQEFRQPRDHTIHRVWFLGGRIQCAVRAVRSADADPFAGGCLSGLCSESVRESKHIAQLAKTSKGSFAREGQHGSSEVVFTAWDPPAEVRDVVLRAAEISNADCGSVEFLYDSENGRPYYFDLNMLSSLPESSAATALSDPLRIWDDAFDPYGSLADFVASRLPSDVRNLSDVADS